MAYYGLWNTALRAATTTYGATKGRRKQEKTYISNEFSEYHEVKRRQGNYVPLKFRQSL